jgi:hypothetical protein
MLGVDPIDILRDDIKEASKVLSAAQRSQVADDIDGFLEEMNRMPQKFSPTEGGIELKRLYAIHGERRKALVSGGLSVEWAKEAFRESYLLALIKAPSDPEGFKMTHTLLSQLRELLEMQWN